MGTVLTQPLPHQATLQLAKCGVLLPVVEADSGLWLAITLAIPPPTSVHPCLDHDSLLYPRILTIWCFNLVMIGSRISIPVDSSFCQSSPDDNEPPQTRVMDIGRHSRLFVSGCRWELCNSCSHPRPKLDRKLTGKCSKYQVWNHHVMQSIICIPKAR
ncbi:hypothetical protein K461DRAFT_93890 [Myriangium duriaei CBS 260.36]|uniref:Uncharacterized protein n=1 Tax=Myriangium duriaei CBS 260.36 TaxID=1168546 RepID=A0A9P4JA78_9PEZI|nr:hypothetical protein K461DRAFT_93890 [Myriangium duriaei CBS 260.36]